MIKPSLTDNQLWEESLIRLKENHFLDLARMYLGVIKTPYNKDRLITELAAFLRKEENQQTLLALLSKNDISILNAVTYIPYANKEKLTVFFLGQFLTSVLYEYLMNLEERLIIFRSLDEESGKEIFSINPLLKDCLQSHLNLSVLLPLPKKRQENDLNSDKKYGNLIIQDGQDVLSARLLATWFAFIAENTETCRIDGSFKKKTLEQIKHLFHSVSTPFLLKLNTALTNLLLLVQDGTNLIPNERKWRSFSSLPAKVQYAYIAVASCGRFSRDTLAKHASFANFITSSIPKEGYTYQTLLRLSFLLQEQDTTSLKHHSATFAQILKKATDPQKNTEIFSTEALIEAMLLFGILSILGKDKNDSIIIGPSNKENSIKNIEKTGEIHNSGLFLSAADIAGSISIDAGFSVTLLRDLPLANLLDLVQYMDLTNFDTVCRYTITRSACMRAFDRGINEQNILDSLEKTAGFTLPQNLIFSIKEWQSTYNSASLFKGYVLQVSQKNQIQVENNPILTPYIKMTLAAGIYLLDFASDEDATTTIQKSGIDFIGIPKKFYEEQESLPFANFSHIPLSSSILEMYDEKTAIKQPLNDDTDSIVNIHYLKNEKKDNHFKKMKDALDALDLPLGEKEGLLVRINRKIILTSTQLWGDSVRVEKTEASGMDFVGKIYVIEQAIATSSMIEVQIHSNIYLGHPTRIEKNSGDSTLTMVLEDTEKAIKLSIGQARSIKRFRGSIFKESR